VTRLYDQIGIRQLCEQKINYYFQQASQTLSEVNVPDERKAQLRQYMDELLHRNK
jgi:geranylgeranyl diphosphate synthase type II